MANLNAPYGLIPFQSASGSASNFEMVQGQIAYNDSTKIFRGDPVIMKNTGYIGQWVNGQDANLMYGVFWGCTYLSSSLSKQVENSYWPGADVASNAQNSIIAWIVPIKGAGAPLFRVQSDGTGVAFADIGQNADITLGTGNTLNGQSGAYLSNLGTTNTLPFQVAGLYGGPQGAGGFGGIQPGTNGPYAGSATGAYNWVIVRANTSALTGI